MDQNTQQASTTDVYNLLQAFIQQSTKGTEEIKAEIKSIKSDISKQIETLQEENTQLKKENLTLKNRLLETERKLKKYNLVFYGIPEKEPDAHRDFETILDLLNKKLGINCRFEDIRDIFRIGKVEEGRHRPVLIECLTYPLKAAILEKKKALKGTGVFVAKDFIPEDYTEQKILRFHLNTARRNNKNAKIVGNRLIIEEEEYTANQLENTLKEKSKAKEKPEETSGSSSVCPDNTAAQPDATQEEDKEKTSIKKRKNNENTPEGQVKRSNRLKKNVDLCH